MIKTYFLIAKVLSTKSFVKISFERWLSSELVKSDDVEFWLKVDEEVFGHLFDVQKPHKNPNDIAKSAVAMIASVKVLSE